MVVTTLKHRYTTQKNKYQSTSTNIYSAATRLKALLDKVDHVTVVLLVVHKVLR